MTTEAPEGGQSHLQETTAPSDASRNCLATSCEQLSWYATYTRSARIGYYVLEMLAIVLAAAVPVATPVVVAVVVLCGRRDLHTIFNTHRPALLGFNRMGQGLFLQVEGTFGMRRAMLRGEDDLSGGDWFESSRRSKTPGHAFGWYDEQDPLVANSSLSSAGRPRLASTEQSRDSIELSRGCALAECAADGVVEGFSGATACEAAPGDFERVDE